MSDNCWQLTRETNWKIPENGTRITNQAFEDAIRICYVHLVLDDQFNVQAQALVAFLSEIAPKGEIRDAEYIADGQWHLAFSLDPIRCGRIMPPNAPWGPHVLDGTAHVQVCLADSKPQEYFHQCRMLRRFLNHYAPDGVIRVEVNA